MHGTLFTKCKETLDKMSASPQSDWRITDLETLADRIGLIVRKPKRGSHYTFASPHVDRIEPIPYKRPIKPVYVKKFVTLALRHISAEERMK